MADNLSIGNLVVSTILLIIIITFGAPLLVTYQGATATGGAPEPGAAANVLNTSAFLTSNGVNGIYNPIASTAYSSGTNASGFNIPIATLQQLGGIAFIYVGIGQFLGYISQLGVIIPFAITALFGLIPGVTTSTALNIAFIGSLLFDLIAMRIIVVGISGWMKADFWNM